MRKFKEYLVGGAVRDTLLGLKNKDLDYTFVFDEIKPNETAEECFNDMYDIIKTRGEIFLSTPSCYTIRYKDNVTKEAKDVVLARKEIGYIPNTRIPIVVPGTLYDDLERRDFRLNALAKDEDGNIVDYFNGLEDLKNGILQTPIDTKKTFNDDCLRIIRAIRFLITKGFTLSPEVEYEILNYDYENKMFVISEERIREELYKCFKYDTLKTLKVLNNFERLRDYIFTRTNLWLKPTSEK
jgi:tRNA nucleotidyltransferase/poly(A) polymerase